MALGILDTAASITGGVIVRLLQDPCPGAHGALEGCVDILHANEQILSHLSKPLRISEVWARPPHHDEAILAKRHFRVPQSPVGPCMPEPFTHTEGFGQPFQRAGEIFIEEVRCDPWRWRWRWLRHWRGPRANRVQSGARSRPCIV